MKNNKESFGEQWMMNEKDELVEEYPFLLIQSTDLHCEEIISKVHQLGGGTAARINKSAHNLLTTLSFISPDLKLDGVKLNSWVNERNSKEVLSNLQTYISNT